MTLIDGDRIITKQEYDDEHEEFIEKKMSIIDYINTYTDEGVTEADVIKQMDWISVDKRLPDSDGCYRVIEKSGRVGTYVFHKEGNSEEYWKRCAIAWQENPKPYRAEKVRNKR